MMSNRSGGGGGHHKVPCPKIKIKTEEEKHTHTMAITFPLIYCVRFLFLGHYRIKVNLLKIDIERLVCACE